MVQKYIIDKTDLPKLIQGEELALTQGSKYRAFCIEINEKLTNGDVIKALFPNGSYGTNGNEVHVFGIGGNGILVFTKDWWNALYKAGDTDADSN